MRAEPVGIVPWTRWADWAFATVVEACDRAFVDVVAETAAPEATRHPARVKTSNARKVDSLSHQARSRPHRPISSTKGNRVDSAPSFYGPRHSFNTVRQILESFVFRARGDSIHISRRQDSE
jgi:hypothetical protein